MALAFAVHRSGAAGVQTALAQTSYPCVNDAPDPYQRGVSFAPLPDGRIWGSTAGVAVAPDGYDQQPMSVSSTAEGVGVDKDGNLYGDEVGPKDLKKYLKK